MKRIIAAAAILLLILSACLLVSCNRQTNDAPADSMAGSYRMVDAAGVGSKELLELKDGIRLEVRSDNTATLSLMNDTHEIRFDPERNICTSPDDDQEVPYTFDGKQIIMDSEPFRMVFER